MASLTRWVLAHKAAIMAFWVVVTLVGLVSLRHATKSLTHDFTVPGREGYEANQTVVANYDNGGDNTPFVPVITFPRRNTVNRPAAKAQIAKAFAAINLAFPGTRIASYGSTGNRAFVSRDGRTTFALVYPPLKRRFGVAQLARAVPLLARVKRAGAQVHITGIAPLKGGARVHGPGPFAETLIGMVGALIILAFVFGSLLAGVPILIAIIAIPAVFLIVWILTAVTQVSFIVEYLVALIGLGVAIDYSLLIVMRWREERAKGADNETAVVRTMESAGRAVVISGTTVAVGLVSLVVVPLPFLRSVGIAGMLIPVVSVAVALTALPILLATLGPDLDGHKSRGAERPSRFWTAWGRAVVRWRWPAAILALLILVLLLLPAISLNVGDPTAASLARSGDAYLGLKQLERAGIGVGVLTPVEVITPGTLAPSLTARLSQVAGVRGVIAPGGVAWRQNGLAIVDVLPSADGGTTAGQSTLDRIRQAAHAVSSAARVGGQTAQTSDFVSAVYGSFPLMVALVALVTYVLLARAFRSFLLPLKAVVLVLLSVGAAWGVVVLVWQDGHGSSFIWGVSATESITTFIPLMIFAFLFGLSMDYEVFILARMREEYDESRSSDRAVVAGIARTARLVTSAALILIVAFLSLTTGKEVVVKIFATGMAVGILLDATVVRMLLVPALVSLLGRWSWWLPPSLDRAMRPVRPRAAEGE